MARARLLKPEFFEDEKLNALPFGARLLYQSMWCLADREGRLEDRPTRIAAFAFPPMGNERQQASARRESQAWMDLLINSGMVCRYEVDGEAYLLIRHFTDHQKIHPNEPKSTLPPPLVTIGNQRNPKVTNVAGSGSRSRSRNKAEAEADAGARAFEPVSVEDRSFSGQYVWHYEQRQGRHPGGAAVAAAEQLERDFGREACITVASDLSWEKHPNYMRPILVERTKEPSNGSKRTESREPTGAAEGDRFADFAWKPDGA